MLWTFASENGKTGSIPTAWIGKDKAESRASCKGCILLDSHDCYAHYGTPAIGHASLSKAAARGEDRSMERAFKNRSVQAKMVRIGAIGEPGVLPLSWWKKIRATAKSAKLDVIAYTHRWRKRPDLAKEAMASCDSMDEVDEALRMGFRVAVVLPEDHKGLRFTTPGGAKGLVCPAIATGHKVQCNECRKCDASRPGPVIGFPNHGPKARGIRRSRAAKAAKEQKDAESL